MQGGARLTGWEVLKTNFFMVPVLLLHDSEELLLISFPSPQIGTAQWSLRRVKDALESGDHDGKRPGGVHDDCNRDDQGKALLYEDRVLDNTWHIPGEIR